MIRALLHVPASGVQQPSFPIHASSESGSDTAIGGRTLACMECYPLCDVTCSVSHMATNLALDPALLERALSVSGEKTKKAAVTRALEEFIARRDQARLVELFGALEWDAGFDLKAERTRG